MNRIPWRPPGPRAGLLVCLAVLHLLPAIVTLARTDPITQLAQTVPAFAAEAVVQAAGADLEVLGYSVPTTCDWNQDGLFDLIVGEGGYLTAEGKVRIYLNTGVAGAPAFTTWSYAQGPDGDLAVAAGNCLGIFPRLVQYDGDGCKDLLAGTADGQVLVYLNTGPDAAPVFAAAVAVEAGPAGAKTAVDVGLRATPSLADWNGDGLGDLVVGALDGKVRIYLDGGIPGAPDFQAPIYAEDQGGVLVVPDMYSSPVFSDLDGDGLADLVCGNSAGQILFYANTGTAAAPVFAAGVLLAAGGAPIDLEGWPRSRPCLCDWTGDGRPDLLVGALGGLVRLYEGSPMSGAPQPSPVRLLGTYPNPFNARLAIRFAVPDGTPAVVEIFAADGSRVRGFDLDGSRPSGIGSVLWDGADAAGRPVPSGIYLCRLRAGGQQRTRKVALVR